MDYLIPCVIFSNIFITHGLISRGYGQAGPLGKYHSYWDYVEVRPGAHMFWWLFNTTNNNVTSPYEKPLVIWLQGGPGDSGTGFGNFAEIGPLNLNLEPRQFSWTKECNVLFIDSPVGTGFSYVSSDEMLATNNAQIAQDLVTLMKAFLNLNPEFRKVPTYIFSESYGGKMAAEFALTWYRSQSSIGSNLKGVVLGSPFISPIDTLTGWAPYLLDRGIIKDDASKRIMQVAEEVKRAISEERWLDALYSLSKPMKLAFLETGGLDIYNVEHENKNYLDDDGITIFSRIHKNRLANLTALMNGYVKTFLRTSTNQTWAAENDAVIITLANDFMKPVSNVVESLLDETNLRVLTYSGQLDLVANSVGTYKWIEKLSWKYAEDWRSSPEIPLIMNNNIEAVYKSYNKFTLFRILGSGHFAPIDSPGQTIEILKYMIGS